MFLQEPQMLLRKSISNTRKFFQKTFQGFKSFLSGGYERLHKTPPFNPFYCGVRDTTTSIHQSFRELDNFYIDFTNRWESSDHHYQKNKPKKRSRSSKKKTIMYSSPKQPMIKDDVYYDGSFMKFMKQNSRQEDLIKEDIDEKNMRSSSHEGGGGSEEEEESCSHMVAQKLKELEMMDASNVDHLFDIEEVLHYYSRLTCPLYLDIVHRFFMQMYSEFFLPVQASNGNNDARPVHQ